MNTQNEFWQLLGLLGEALAIGRQNPQSILERLPKDAVSQRKMGGEYYRVFQCFLYWLSKIREQDLPSPHHYYAARLYWALVWADEYLSHTEKEEQIEQLKESYLAIYEDYFSYSAVIPEFTYYLVMTDIDKVFILRGKENDRLSYAIYDEKTQQWNNEYSDLWQEQIRCHSFPICKIISKKEADLFILNLDERKKSIN